MLNGTLPYHGSKRTTAPEIVKHFRKHEIYYDLFAGSLAVLLAKKPSRQEVASEMNPDVDNLLRCLADTKCASSLWHSAECTPLSEMLFLEAAERLDEPFSSIFRKDAVRAFDFLLVSWQGPSGLAGTTAKPRFAKRNTASGGSTAARWRAVAPSIPEWHDRLRNVEFRNADAFDIIGEVPDREGVTVYADPPYHPESRRGGKYVFDFTPEQHERLADRLAQFRNANIVVSYSTCPTIEKLYKGWERVEISANRKMGNTSGGPAKEESAGEVLFIRNQ